MTPPNMTILTFAQSSWLQVIQEAFSLEHLLWVVSVIPLAAILAGTMYRERVAERWRPWIPRLAIALSAGFILVIVALIATNVRSPREFDFKFFWVWGVAAAEGTCPYDHDNLLRIVESINPSEDLKNELHGFYPPPTMLLFAPLGWMPFKLALLIWNLVQGAALAGCLYLLVQIFASERRSENVIVLITMGLAYWSTAGTFYFSQTNFLVLLALLLFWRDRERKIAGIWLALGVLVKPLVLAVGLYLLLRGRWSTLVTMFCGLTALVIVTGLIFGPDIYVDYANSDGASSQNPISQDINQSVSGVLLRLTETEPAAGLSSLLNVPIILAVIGFIILATGAIILRTNGAGDPYAVGATFAMMLLIYPATLTHYGVHLLPPMALLVTENQRPGDRRGWALFVVLTAFLLSAFRITFWAVLILWIAMAVEGILITRKTNASKELSAG